ncbi:phosphate/phosphite/phosphonate ABC transporter substrate-binding protein [Chloroflexota bacterium]
MDLLRVTSLQSPNADFFCEMIAAYLGSRMGLHSEWVGDIPWQERSRLLDDGQIHVGWICGLPYVRRADQAQPTVALLAAPVMRAGRYEDRPIYFSDVVVRQDSRYAECSDLRGGTWAFNEPGSQSGYMISRYHLATLGETEGYFGRVVRAGSHLRALEMILNGRVDAAAIDSTVLELELASRPELGKLLRTVEVLGPSPIPPWVANRGLPVATRTAIRRRFLEMHQDVEGREILSRGQTARFVWVRDLDYDPIREMARQAEGVRWEA